MELNKIHNIDCLAGLKMLADKSVHCVVTSPPYFALRDYGTAVWTGGKADCDHKSSDTPEKRGIKKSTLTGGKKSTGHQQEGFKAKCGKCGAIRTDQQVGLEETPELFIDRLVNIFREVKRVLRDDGTCWLNIGDSYWGGKGKSGQSYSSEYQNKRYNDGRSYNGGQHQIAGKNQTRPTDRKHQNIKPKDLTGIPWMLAFALRDDGWYLRQDIIWSKPNPMPESVSDRCTKSHEYIFLLSKKNKYYYDAKSIATPYADKTYTTFGIPSKGYGDGSGMIQSENWANSIKVRKPKQWKTPDGWDTTPGSHGSIHRNGREKGRKARPSDNHGGNQGAGDIPMGIDGSKFKGHSGNLANKRSVWTVATQAFKEAHFATFPEGIIVDCIKAGCPPDGVVLDPFMGVGTTALVAQKLGRNFIGFELNAKYVTMANKRIDTNLGMFSPNYIIK